MRSREWVKDELRALRVEEPVLFGIIMGHGTTVTIASAAGITVTEARPQIERLYKEGRIFRAYGRAWQLRRGHKDSARLKELRDLAVVYKIRPSFGSSSR